MHERPKIVCALCFAQPYRGLSFLLGVAIVAETHARCGKRVTWH